MATVNSPPKGHQDYERRDALLELRPAADGAQLVLTHPDGTQAQAPLSRHALDEAMAGRVALLAASLRANAVAQRLGAPEWSSGFKLLRVCLQLGRREWAGIDWERLAGQLDPCLVRDCPVRPRIAQVPLTFPIRVLEAGLSPVVGQALANVFSYLAEPDEEARREAHSVAIVDAAVDPSRIREHPAEAGWPTVDVLHLRGDTAADSGLLKWLPRFMDARQTRLLILECPPARLSQALLLAQAIVEGAGPAVFVTPLEGVNWNWFYGGVTHDRPLDWIRMDVRGGALFAGAGREELLRYSHLPASVAGPAALSEFVATIGRPRVGAASAWRQASQFPEVASAAVARVAAALGAPAEAGEARVFNVAAFDAPRRLRFQSLVAAEIGASGLHTPALERAFAAQQRASPGVVDSAELGHLIASGAMPLRGLGQDLAGRALGDRLRTLAAMKHKLSYELHESEGMLPVAAGVAAARATLARLPRKRAPRSRAARHVNAALFTSTRRGELRRLPPMGPHLLRSGQQVHLGVQIGERDRLLVTIGSTALIEELDRQPDGVWLEIGVTAYDFQLIGDPVQPLWLPQSGPSALATFALCVPGATPIPGVARVRFSIYHQNNVVQSFLVAVRVAAAGPATDRTMARVLGVRPSRIEALGRPAYITRLEYRARGIDDARAAAPRALSIVANDNSGQKVLTFKGDELFHVATGVDVDELVRNAREALNRASQNERGQYRYLSGNELNRGDQDELLAVLWDVALSGWQLFDQLLPGESARKLVLDKLDAGGGVHAAHIDVSKTVPWGLLYDRPLRERESIDDPRDAASPPRPVERAVCHAGFPSLDGSVRCGGAGCVLHPEENRRRYEEGRPLLCEETVICPQRFWGFRVPVEVPVQQVDGIDGKRMAPIRTRIDSARPLVFAAAFNPHLDKQMLGDAADGMHSVHIRDLVDAHQGRYVAPIRPGRDAVLDMLATLQPDVVYLYCHGVQGGETRSGRRLSDSLDFGKGHAGVVADLVESSDLHGVDWQHGPLVFVNGCSGVGFRTHAPSRFIRKFIQGRKASAVIGTEVTVWEALAREFAETFFSALLATRQPSQALLLARRALMAKNNPLGLVYTLYGSIDLVV